jgi:hypothetical protein
MKLGSNITPGNTAIGAQAGHTSGLASSWLAYNSQGTTALHIFVRAGQISAIPPAFLNLPYCLTKDRQGVTVLRDIILKMQLDRISYLEPNNFKELGVARQLEWEEALETNGAPENEVERLKLLTTGITHKPVKPHQTMEIT